MGQGDVMGYLETCKVPVSRKQIAEGLKQDIIKISHHIQKLIRWGDIEFIEYSGEEVKEKAGYSPGRRTRFYFIKGRIKI